MKEISKLGLILLLICAIAAALLSLAYDFTIDKIVAQREMTSQLSRKEVLPDAESFEMIEDGLLDKVKLENELVVEIYEGLSGGTLVGYTVKTLPSGFGGSVEVITGISSDGEVTGMRVGNHQETPGLGANSTLPDFYEQYVGKSTKSELAVVKAGASGNEIQAISGATITSKAVTKGVNMAVDAYKLVSGL
ncbi:MAG: RnfABCDGE type electron transport complex subunit G [Peptostreptococcaceae bacterium]|nr:RnfABCDGE type electron transport complex subunit G [Peptostreptococcaceae bacterium]